MDRVRRAIIATAEALAVDIKVADVEVARSAATNGIRTTAATIVVQNTACRSIQEGSLTRRKAALTMAVAIAAIRFLARSLNLSIDRAIRDLICA